MAHHRYNRQQLVKCKLWETPRPHNYQQTLKGAFLIFKTLWKDAGFTQDFGVPKLTRGSTFPSHRQTWYCCRRVPKYSPQMSSFPPHEIPGRPYASCLFCWSVNNETQKQKPTCANWPGPSPSTQMINSKKGRELLEAYSGPWNKTQLLHLLWKSH